MINTIRPKILIVDDEIINVRVLDNMLRDKYETMVALTGEQALKRATLTPPDLILLDIALGDMDGFKVFEYLARNEITWQIPVIFVTALAHENDEKKGLELGAVDYITKPFRPSIIRARIHNHLELKRQRDLLNFMSSEDSLTGIANRHGLDVFLAQAWQVAVRFDEPIALIAMDIDHFKKYNECYGYIAGNKCIKKVAEQLTASLVRKTDILARFRDDEFMCVLPRTDLEGALLVTKRFQINLHAKAPTHQYNSGHDVVTLSYGIAVIQPGWQPSDESILTNLAHTHLLIAKQAGGNKICHDGSSIYPQ
ncbi:MAG: diguanylate cyclase [Methylovulum sp.]|jgi:diguanylate cyclase (GGDEF)-like protein|nr:diguanylate cyclase [Methylovulum sp.]MCF7999599.1 diguanylate cyclase [Methylovulum sp.]